MSGRWHVIRDNGGLTLARHLPVRFDLQAETTLPSGDPLRLAHQIRQDMWRVLQNLRGFSPVVQVMPCDAGWHITAGGRLLAPATQTSRQQVQDVLETGRNRARWMRHAARGRTDREGLVT